MALTVTASTALANRFVLQVVVLTGAAASQPGRTVSAGSVLSASITPEFTGSLIYGMANVLPNGGTWPYSSFDSNTTQLTWSSFSSSGGNGAAAIVSSSTTTSGTPVTLGLIPQAGDIIELLVLCEIIASGTLAVDPSTPNPVPFPSGAGKITTGTSVTTSSFSPPGGSLLVAMVTGIIHPPAVSDSQGLTWTKQVSLTNGATVQVWTAPVPGGPPPPSGPPFSFRASLGPPRWDVQLGPERWDVKAGPPRWNASLGWPPGTSS